MTSNDLEGHFKFSTIRTLSESNILKIQHLFTTT